MRRAAKALPFGLLILLGLTLLFRKDTGVENRPEQAVPSKAAVAAPAVAAPEVTVEHILVTADVVNTRLFQPRASSAPTVAIRAADRRTRISTPNALARAEDSSLRARTRRVILGDGRHKPQPFPRINNN